MQPEWSHLVAVEHWRISQDAHSTIRRVLEMRRIERSVKPPLNHHEKIKLSIPVASFDHNWWKFEETREEDRFNLCWGSEVVVALYWRKSETQPNLDFLTFEITGVLNLLPRRSMHQLFIIHLPSSPSHSHCLPYTQLIYRNQPILQYSHRIDTPSPIRIANWPVALSFHLIIISLPFFSLPLSIRPTLSSYMTIDIACDWKREVYPSHGFPYLPSLPCSLLVSIFLIIVIPICHKNLDCLCLPLELLW